MSFAQAAAVTGRNVTRAELLAAVAVYDSSAASTAYSERVRGRARTIASSVRDRLTNGDFRVGDRIHLQVQGPTQLLDSTLAVGDSLILNVPGIRQVRLHGVLRSELASVLARDLGEVVRQPRITARTLLRVAVVGEVGTPGFRTVPEAMLVDQLLTLSGGPTATAALDRIRLMRGEEVILDGPAIAQAIAYGRTLEMLDFQDGDVLAIPPKGAPWDRTAVLQLAGFMLTPLLTILAAR